MKITRKMSVFALIAVLLSAISISLVWAEGDVKLLGITVEDTYPNGCVDCHSNQGAHRVDRLNILVNNIDGHPNVTQIVNTLPEGCGMCHRPGVAAGPLNTQTHRIHYENPAENDFIGYYAGECLACHTLNPATGQMSIKSGPKNW
jgi:hypothetical protein